jgi:hypothetical protein
LSKRSSTISVSTGGWNIAVSTYRYARKAPTPAAATLKVVLLKKPPFFAGCPPAVERNLVKDLVDPDRVLRHIFLNEPTKSLAGRLVSQILVKIKKKSRVYNRTFLL